MSMVVPLERGTAMAAAPAPTRITTRQLIEEMRELCELGEPPDARAALSRHPEAAGDRQVLRDLACEEFSRRQASGERLELAEFAARFPSCGASLRELLVTRQFFEVNPDLLDDDETAPSWPEAGDNLLGEFHLLRELGHGSFSRVYLANELNVGERLVVVKVSVLDGAFEAEALGSLRHPNIVPVHSLKADDRAGWTVVCMPYHGTATLADVVAHVSGPRGLPARAAAILAAVGDDGPRDQRVPERVPPHALLHDGTYVEGALHVGVQLADAVAAVHGRRIIHRDLKPANVLMTPDGRPMLLDFNLSCDEEVAEQALGGTLPYMAPEQTLAMLHASADGPGGIDARTDLFSLGVMLYELLTGKHSFGLFPRGISRQELGRRLLERQRAGAVPLRQVNAAVDGTAARAIDRCLACDPQQRPASAAELAAALRAGLTGRRRALRRAKAYWRPLAAAALLVVGGSLFSTYQAAHTDHARAGERAHERKRYDEAVLHFTRALELSGDSARLRFRRGKAFYRLGDIDRAITDFRKADELGGGKDGKVLAALAYCFIHPDRLHHDAAIGYYKKALASGLKTARVYNNLGYSCLQSGEFPEARVYLGEAITKDARLQSAYHNRMLLTVREGFRRYPPPVRFVPLFGVPCVYPRAPSPGHQALDEAEMASARAILNEAVADMRKALELGPPTAELYQDAARLCAIMAGWDGRLAEEGLRCIQKAIEYGRTPEFLAGDQILQMGLGKLPGYANALNVPASGRVAVPAERAIDPVLDVAVRD